MNNDIEIKNIEIKEENDTIQVEITNETEALIAAHNANPDAHSSITKKVTGEIEALQGQINELEENMVSNLNLPTNFQTLKTMKTLYRNKR